MKMRTPQFWTTRNTLSTLLLPFTILYDMVNTLNRAQAHVAVLSVPVICIGNLTMGGAGKTPVALYVGNHLKLQGVNAFFLSRGYGGKFAGPVMVDPAAHSASDVGDEPLLLAGILPTVVAKDRLAGARFAISKGAMAIIMDDGFQNPAITKNLSLLVVDGERGFGNGRLFPAGPLREQPQEGFKRAHAVIIINRTSYTPAIPAERPQFIARTAFKNAASLKGKKVYAFCGLAYPQKFFDMLGGAGAQLTGSESFPDHYPYKDSDTRRLLLASKEKDAMLVTTAKDAVRLSPLFRECVVVVELEIEFDNPAVIDNVLSYVISPPTPD